MTRCPKKAVETSARKVRVRKAKRRRGKERS